MQILRQTVDLVSLYTLPVDPRRAPLRLTRPRRPRPHGRVDLVVLLISILSTTPRTLLVDPVAAPS